MGYPTNLLSPGETIVKEMRPHWRAVIVPSLILVAVFAAGGYVYVNTSNDYFHYFLLGLGGIVAVFYVIRPFLAWVTTQYVFTNRRIITRRGFIAKSGIDVPLDKVNNVRFDITVFGRLLNYGRLEIESANADSDVVIDDVPNVESIQQLIYGLHEENDVRRRKSTED